MKIYGNIFFFTYQKWNGTRLLAKLESKESEVAYLRGALKEELGDSLTDSTVVEITATGNLRICKKILDNTKDILPDLASFTVAFVGGTQVGKSTLIRSLTPFSCPKPIVADPKSDRSFCILSLLCLFSNGTIESTTGNVDLYDTEINSNQNTIPVRYLDVEGITGLKHIIPVTAATRFYKIQSMAQSNCFIFY